jgi:hypothetical protein
MPVGNGGGAIAITETSDPALPSCVSGNASVQVIANAVGLKIRGVTGVPQHQTDGVLDVNGRIMVLHPRNQSLYTPPSPVMSRVRRRATYNQEDIQYCISKHALQYMYKSLQQYLPGDVKDPTELHIWKLDSEYLGDD